MITLQGCDKVVTRLQGLHNLVTTLSFLYGKVANWIIVDILKYLINPMLLANSWHLINPQCACAERVTVVTLSLCLSLFYFGEGAVFRIETYISTF